MKAKNVKVNLFRTAVTALAVSLAALGAQGAFHDSVQLWAGGPCWAMCNLGAKNPQDSGYYFWWGDTAGCTNGPYMVQCNHGEDIVTNPQCSFCEEYGSQRLQRVSGWHPETNFVMSLKATVLSNVFKFQIEFYPANQTWNKDCAQLKALGYIADASSPRLKATCDAAWKNWGAPWRMPTYDDVAKLCNTHYCTCVWTRVEGVYGRRIFGVQSGYEGKSIFIPAAGVVDGTILDRYGFEGRLWTSDATTNAYTATAWRLYPSRCHMGTDQCFRYLGLPIRPVRDLQ